jgi:hypothetical protein
MRERGHCMLIGARSTEFVARIAGAGKAAFRLQAASILVEHGGWSIGHWWHELLCLLLAAICRDHWL